MVTKQVWDLQRRAASYKRHYAKHDPNDPRYLAVLRELAEARARAAQDEADRLRDEADAMAPASVAS